MNRPKNKYHDFIYTVEHEIRAISECKKEPVLFDEVLDVLKKRRIEEGGQLTQYEDASKLRSAIKRLKEYGLIVVVGNRKNQCYLPVDSSLTPTHQGGLKNKDIQKTVDSILKIKERIQRCYEMLDEKQEELLVKLKSYYPAESLVASVPLRKDDPNKEKPTVNFDVTESWHMTCPFCDEEQEAPFNSANPMSPMDVTCERCDEIFTLTYDRDD
jgi:hypothetical protein